MANTTIKITQLPNIGNGLAANTILPVVNTTGTATGQTFAQYQSTTSECVALSDNYWYGDIALSAIYGRTLSSSEVLENYQSLIGRYGLA